MKYDLTFVFKKPILIIAFAVSFGVTALAQQYSFTRAEYDQMAAILGESPTSGKDEFKKAYRKLGMKYHPDRNSDPQAEEKFKRIKEAYEYLEGRNYIRPEDPRAQVAGNRSSTEGSAFQDFAAYYGVKPKNQDFKSGFTQNRAKAEKTSTSFTKEIIFQYSGRWINGRAVRKNDDGSIDTTQYRGITSYSVRVDNSPLEGKTVTVNYNDTQIRLERIIKVFDNGTVLVESNFLVPSNRYTVEVANTPLFGKSIRVHYGAAGTRVEIARKEFSDGSILTMQGVLVPAGRFVKEVANSQLVGRSALIRYSNPRVEIIKAEFEDGSISTSQNPDIRKDQFVLERRNDFLVNQLVIVNTANGPVKLRVDQVFEDGTLLTKQGDILAPRSYVLDESVYTCRAKFR